MAKKVLQGWKKAVVYNPANGDRVQMNRIIPGMSELPDDPNVKTETATGQAWGGQIWPVTIGFADGEGLALLESWMVAYAKVSAAIFAPAGMSILFQDTEEIDFRPGTGVNAREGLAVNQVHIEAIGSNLNVRQVKNLARAISFSSSQGSLVLPFQGITLTLSASYTAPDAATMVIEAKDFAGNQVAISSQAASAGRVSTVITLPADTWSVDIDLLDGGTGTVEDIALRGDGSVEYIGY